MGVGGKGKGGGGPLADFVLVPQHVKVGGLRVHQVFAILIFIRQH